MTVRAPGATLAAVLAGGTGLLAAPVALDAAVEGKPQEYEQVSILDTPVDGLQCPVAHDSFLEQGWDCAGTWLEVREMDDSSEEALRRTLRVVNLGDAHPRARFTAWPEGAMVADRHTVVLAVEGSHVALTGPNASALAPVIWSAVRDEAPPRAMKEELRRLPGGPAEAPRHELREGLGEFL